MNEELPEKLTFSVVVERPPSREEDLAAAQQVQVVQARHPQEAVHLALDRRVDLQGQVACGVLLHGEHVEVRGPKVQTFWAVPRVRDGLPVHHLQWCQTESYNLHWEDRPLAGQEVREIFGNKLLGTVLRTGGNLLYYRAVGDGPDAEEKTLIWAFRNTLNTLHVWETPKTDAAVPV